MHKSLIAAVSDLEASARVAGSDLEIEFQKGFRQGEARRGDEEFVLGCQEEFVDHLDYARLMFNRLGQVKTPEDAKSILQTIQSGLNQVASQLGAAMGASPSWGRR